ncbi:MAG TPA: alpha-L-arabinofuranosidase C-terminal domain-containing protein, partial [Acidobacteriaceae bacterium]|nr:alpha-L-arabinofuranosidase C-terminal domain-containing protein [Acidobacteriaceae bacterium]
EWVLTPFGNAAGATESDRTNGPSAALPHSLKVVVKQADAANPLGIVNGGWWGMAIRPNTTYTGSFYGKADADETVKVSLVSDITGQTLASATVPSVGKDWKKYDYTLRTGADVVPASTNHLLVSFEKPGTVWLQLLSLFPPTYHDRTNGNRADIMQMLADMHPAFLRLPGGNYLEGDHINERFDWKKTIGPLVDRPGHRSPWRYRSTDGLGLLEFLEWCEDLRIQPVLAVYAGYSLSQEHVNPGKDLEPYVQDALDEIEYVTGDASTKWGAERIKDGHPAVFPLTYVEVGNEDSFDRSKSYDARYAQFYDAIKKKYPNLQIIATTPVKGHVMDVLDDHYYKRAEQFFADVHHYDKADRNGPKIFVGEWATREGSPTTNFGAALGDAAWMTGMERNSDLIILASYAPLFVNVNPDAMQWASDLIGYNASSVYGSPSYYAQALFANHLGTEILGANLQGGGDRLFYSATRGNGTIYLKLVNASSNPQQVKIALAGANNVKPAAKLVSLSAPSTATTNSITDPKRVVPVESTIKGVGKEFTRTLPAYSIQIFDIGAQ